jgi:hypothetical protein
VTFNRDVQTRRTLPVSYRTGRAFGHLRLVTPPVDPGVDAFAADPDRVLDRTSGSSSSDLDPDDIGDRRPSPGTPHEWLRGD